MTTDFKILRQNDLTHKVIKAFYQVYNNLGYGFLEKVYENALLIELAKMNVPVQAQSPIQVLYEGNLIGEYFADILVNKQIIVEIKVAKNLTFEHEAQLLNYLKATDIEVGLLLNFGPKAQVKRKLFDNWRKENPALLTE